MITDGTLMMLDEKNQVSCMLVKSVQEMEKIKSDWMAMQWQPDHDYDNFIALLNIRKEIEKPYIIVINNGVKGIIAGRIENGYMPIKFGYWTLFKMPVRTLTVGYGGISGEIQKQAPEQVRGQIEDVYKDERVDIVVIENININSNLYKLLSNDVNQKKPTLMMPITRQWTITVQATYELYWASLSKNVKKNMKNYSNRLTKKYGQSLEIKKYRNIDEINQLLEDTETIARNTYHRGLGVGFILNDESRNYYRTMLERDAHRSYILYIDKTPIAFWSATKYKNVFYMIATGFLPEYRDDHIGTYLLLKAIEDSMDDKSVEKIDFGLGDAEYKKIFCDECNELTTLMMYSGNTKGKILYMTSALICKLEDTVKALLNKYKIEGKIKQKWRKIFEKAS